MAVLISGAAAPAGLRRDHRPHLDGIRALAVLLVVAFHADLDQLSGGFVGVDVFFVLSGYLVTGLLVAELITTDRLRLRRFYARRVRRLLPMALLVLVVTGLVYAAVAAPALVDDAANGFRASFLYVANWYFIDQSTDYFGSNVEASPILHYWSLAIEEQFYLVWPLVFLALWFALRPAGHRRVRAAAGVTAIVGIVSLVFAHRLGQDDIDRAYYGTDTRAYQLLLGATLALLPTLGVRRLPRAWCDAMGWIGLGAILTLGTSLIELSPIGRGTAVAAATGVVLLAVESDGGTSLGRVLSRQPVVWLGTISYSIYLWHLPVIYLLTEQAGLDNELGVFALATVASIALAAASARLLENPIRRSSTLEPRPIPVAVSGLVLSLALGAAIVPVLSGVGATSANPDLDWAAAVDDAAPLSDCVDTVPSECTIVEGDGLHIALVGDSHVRVWQSAFEEIAQRRGYKLSVLWRGGCSWHRDVSVALAEDRMQTCFESQATWFDEVLPALDPDIVVLAHRATFDPARPFFANLEAFENSIEPTVRGLVNDGRRVVILEPLPITSPENDPLVCLSDGGTNSECGFDATAELTPLEVIYRSLDNSADIISVDADRIECPNLPRCDALDGSVIVMRDQSHMTATYVRSRSRDLEQLLIDRGALPA